MANRFLVLIATGALLVCARPLAAQRVRGQVVLPDSATPASGVIVVATGDAGATVLRALTTGRGTFDLALPHAGRFEVRVLRIGFAPTIVPAVEVATADVSQLRIVLGSERIALARVTVRGRSECGAKADAGALVAKVWEEARKALLASQLVADRPLVAEWIQFDRTLEPGGARVRKQSVRSTRSPTTHAFRSRAADSLASEGYIVEDGGDWTFYAPDADVLLSESFANLHCFHLEPPPAGKPTLIGLGFTPTSGRETRDIEGTIWLERESAELRSLDFRYTNVPSAAERASAGGRVEFLRLASGEWLVSRWNILMPQLGAPGKSSQELESAVLIASPDAAVKSVHITGGEVNSVSRGDSLLYRSTGATFAVQIVARDSAIAVGGATISLDGTDYFLRSDSLGRARLSPVLAGRYRAHATTPLMDSLGAAPVERDVEIREDLTRVDTLVLPRALDLVRAGCKGEPVRDNESLLRGTVHDSLGRPVAHAAVTVTFQNNFTLTGDTFGYSERTIGALSDEQGKWRLCGVPQGKVMAVRVQTDDGADAQKIRLDEGQAMGATNLVIRPSSAAADLAMSGGGAPGAAPSAMVEISVSTRAGVPVPDAIVELVPASGPSRSVRTQASGRALVPAVTPGIFRVRARSIGLKSGELSVRVAAGRNTVPLVLDVAKSPALDTVRIMGGKVVMARHSEFEDRLARHAATAAFTEEDIQKVNPVESYQLLSRVPSIRFIPSGKTGSLLAISSRSMKIDGATLQAVPCFMSVMVDGVLMGGDIDGHTDMSRLPPPADIHGIEVFAGAASIPPQYNGAANDKMCGLIAIWTK
jgi:hypothetical protein